MTTTICNDVIMDKKYILITGANGQLGHEMQNVLAGSDQYEALPTDVAELDITDAQAIEAFFSQHQVDYLVNCAAYTAVDKAEANPELCLKLNAQAVALLAHACHKHGAKMVQISTDYVFGGTGYRPYQETDDTDPQSVYGTTKLQGEQQLMAEAPDSIIIRTAWLYSPYGHNFVKTMMTLPATHPQLRVVADQVGTPTYALDLAHAIMAFITAPEWHSGIYHFSDEGVISWYDFTKAIHEIAGIEGCKVLPCTTEDYPTPATRPHYSVLSKAKVKATLGIEVPYWRDSLKHCIARIKQEQNKQ